MDLKDDIREGIARRVQSGAYASEDEVIKAGLEALEREERAFDDFARARIRESLDDPRPSIPASEVFAELRERSRKRSDDGGA